MRPCPGHHAHPGRQTVEDHQRHRGQQEHPQQLIAVSAPRTEYVVIPAGVVIGQSRRAAPGPAYCEQRGQPSPGPRREHPHPRRQLRCRRIPHPRAQEAPSGLPGQPVSPPDGVRGRHGVDDAVPTRYRASRAGTRSPTSGSAETDGVGGEARSSSAARISVAESVSTRLTSAARLRASRRCTAALRGSPTGPDDHAPRSGADPTRPPCRHRRARRASCSRRSTPTESRPPRRVPVTSRPAVRASRTSATLARRWPTTSTIWVSSTSRLSRISSAARDLGHRRNLESGEVHRPAGARSGGHREGSHSAWQDQRAGVGQRPPGVPQWVGRPAAARTGQQTPYQPSV